MGSNSGRRVHGRGRQRGAASSTGKSANGARQRQQQAPSRGATASQARSRPQKRQGTGTTRSQATVPSAAESMEQRLRDLGADVEIVEQEVFDGTHKLVAHVRHQHSAVRNVNQEAAERMTPLDKVAVFVTDRVGTFGFFLIIFAWTVVWLGFNAIAPRNLRWDPGPAFVLWLFISNMIQIFLMPLLMVGQNLQGRHSEIRAQADFEVNTKAEQEVEAILLHLEQQAAQIERQGEVMLDILRQLQMLAAAPVANAGESAPALATSHADVSATPTASA